MNISMQARRSPVGVSNSLCCDFLEDATQTRLPIVTRGHCFSAGSMIEKDGPRAACVGL